MPNIYTRQPASPEQGSFNGKIASLLHSKTKPNPAGQHHHASGHLTSRTRDSVDSYSTIDELKEAARRDTETKSP